MSDLMRDILMKELNLSTRMLHEGKPLVPRFRIASGDGNFVLFAARQKHLRDQRKCERFIKSFMLWTLARWFVLSQETKGCDGVTSFLIARDLRLAVRRKTVHRPGEPHALNGSTKAPSAEISSRFCRHAAQS